MVSAHLKILVQMGIFPKMGVKIKHVRNHHLDNSEFDWRMTDYILHTSMIIWSWGHSSMIWMWISDKQNQQQLLYIPAEQHVILLKSSIGTHVCWVLNSLYWGWSSSTSLEPSTYASLWDCSFSSTALPSNRGRHMQILLARWEELDSNFPSHIEVNFATKTVT